MEMICYYCQTLWSSNLGQHLCFWSKWNWSSININISICMRVGPRFKIPVSNIVIGNVSLSWKAEIRFLCVSLLSSSTFKCNFQIVRQKYFRALNGIFGKIGTRSSPLVALSLISAYCVPVLTYGIVIKCSSCRVHCAR